MEEKCSIIEMVRAHGSPGVLLWACAVPHALSTAGETEAEQLNGAMWMGFNCSWATASARPPAQAPCPYSLFCPCSCLSLPRARPYLP